jgi:hypothetical protein
VRFLAKSLFSYIQFRADIDVTTTSPHSITMNMAATMVE